MKLKRTLKLKSIAVKKVLFDVEKKLNPTFKIVAYQIFLAVRINAVDASGMVSKFHF